LPLSQAVHVWVQLSPTQVVLHDLFLKPVSLIPPLEPTVAELVAEDPFKESLGIAPCELLAFATSLALTVHLPFSQTVHV
jgi:hypothetical protein